jgi:glycosyltransferase involved in cell wall biosynthesis
MIHELFPEQFFGDSTSLRKKELMLRADKIIAISENTKKDILRIYPEIPAEKIAVVYLGTSYASQSLTVKQGDYILFTGQRAGYKNFIAFTRAVAPLLLKYNLRLICTGQEFYAVEKELFEELHIADRVQCKFVNDVELKALYAEALVFVFPSLYEGFGIPVLEAFAMESPVALANTSSLPEIGGNAAVYFDPYSIQEMRSAVEKVLTSVSLRERLRDQGKIQLQKFSWKQCALETARVYKSLLR